MTLNMQGNWSTLSQKVKIFLYFVVVKIKSRLEFVWYFRILELFLFIIYFRYL